MVVYTVPVGETAIVKAIDVANVNASTATELLIAVDTATNNQTPIMRLGLSALGFDHREMWLVLPPGSEIAVSNSAAVGVNFWISGTELEGVAD